MKKLFQIPLLFLVFCLVNFKTLAQNTIIYVVRHAEKETTNPADRDPGLSLVGKQRAEALGKALKKEKVAAVFSTAFQRTQQTAAPVSQKFNLTTTSYDPRKPAQLAETIKKEYSGKTVLIVGHSNTVTGVVEALGGISPVEQISESEYDYLFRVMIKENGEVETNVKRYGKSAGLSSER
ncbi:histidine phosphatase family protein [Pontibacter sp. FD36]|uniref:SixA phosphatase family protein n=1 Tax=Pontibacter sp. FD36 TaxID=2789860 RepID=UPI0018A916BF|nr:phosphoglycerate mutase family protein [Pontibacter sp. FD36]MBF8964077.1 histidine phosphatase family protein [Pontibacter sp. FD36]